MPRVKANKAPKPRWALVLAARRTELGLRQDDIAERSGELVSQGNVTDIENAKVQLENVGVRKATALARALEWTLEEMQQKTGIDLGQNDAPPASLEYSPDGAYIRLRGLVAGGSGEPEEMDGDLFFVPRHILKKYNIRNPGQELAGYMVNGNSMFYASEGVRARGLKNGDLIAVARFISPSAECPMVVAWDARDEKMLVKLMDEHEDHIVFRSVNSSANPPIIRHKDEVHRYGTVIMRITSEP